MVKSKLPLPSDSVVLRQLNSIHKKGEVKNIDFAKRLTHMKYYTHDQAWGCTFLASS